MKKEEYIWYRIKRGETLKEIANKNGMGWERLYNFNLEDGFLRDPNILIYVDESKADGWCINNKQGILKIPIDI